MFFIGGSGRHPVDSVAGFGGVTFGGAIQKRLYQNTCRRDAP
jgi:hypothetical protein